MSVCVEVHGQGRPVVLVHAISAGQRMWHPQVAALSDRARLITFDARGVGRSPDPVNYPPMPAVGNYPITVVVGENSWWRSDRYAAELVAAVPRASLIRVPDSADPTPLCQPEAFTEIVAECLRWPRTPVP